MNKIATFITHFRTLGSAYAQGLEKNAVLGKILPKTRMGRLGAGVLGATGAGALFKGMQEEEPGMLENAVAGGKDLLSNMSQEDLMQYASLLRGSPGGEYSMGYSPNEMYATEYPPLDDSMGYAASMTPEEQQAYLAYYGGQY